MVVIKLILKISKLKKKEVISPPFLQKEAIENVVKYSKSKKKLQEEVAFIYCQNSIYYFFNYQRRFWKKSPKP